MSDKPTLSSKGYDSKLLPKKTLSDYKECQNDSHFHKCPDDFACDNFYPEDKIKQFLKECLEEPPNCICLHCIGWRKKIKQRAGSNLI